VENLNSLEVQRALDWFLSFIDPVEWRRRKEAIEQQLEAVHSFRASPEEAITLEPVAITINSDRIGWYLYLAETALTEATKYEPIQGARILPIFERLGADFEQLIRIGGIEDKVMRMLSLEMANPDSGLFEILVALLWKKNGWREVEFVPESPPEKRPDIKASSRNAEWAIECNRLAKSSEYSQRERKKWLRMWRYLRDFLIDRRIPAVLDIVFHVELETLPDDFLREQLTGKLSLVSVDRNLRS